MLIFCHSKYNVEGVVLERKLKKLPRERCWCVGSSQVDALDMASKYNQTWKTDLTIGHHDCRDYTNGNEMNDVR